MADFGIYWRDYLEESGESREPITSWLTSREWLINRLHRGDRIWLFIGGDACGDEEAPQQAYLAQLLVVESWGNYAEEDPEGPQFRIVGIADRCILLDPPALIDSIFRQPDKDPKQHIGITRENPFELDGGQVARLLAILRDRYPDVHAAATEV